MSSVKYYQEVTLLPGFEIPLYFVWSNVYRQLHLAFVDCKDENGSVPYGVSFPQYQQEKKQSNLGEKVRVFAASKEALEQLDIKKWLQRLSDYVHVTGIREVPDKIIGYSVYRRVHQNNSSEQKARRFLKRHATETASYEEIVSKFIRSPAKWIQNIPYIKQKSLTNSSSFRLYVEKKECAREALGNFGTYGLSETTTVPEF